MLRKRKIDVQQKRMGVRAQAMVEYTIVISLLITVLVAMQTMITRGGNSMIKLVADQIGNQQGAEQIAFDDIGGIAEEVFERKSFIENSVSLSDISSSKERQDFLGDVSYIYNDEGLTQSEVTINLGFTPTTNPE